MFGIGTGEFIMLCSSDSLRGCEGLAIGCCAAEGASAGFCRALDGIDEGGEGWDPEWLPIDGLKGDLQNVFILRTLPHAQAIVNAIGEDGSKKIVVVGSSFIGMEVGNALAGKKHDVTIVGMESEPMEKVMGKDLGKVFRSLVEKAGVKFKMNASVEKGLPSESDPKKIGAVQLGDGTKIEADLVIEGVGIRPSTDYLKDNS